MNRTYTPFGCIQLIAVFVFIVSIMLGHFHVIIIAIGFWIADYYIRKKERKDLEVDRIYKQKQKEKESLLVRIEELESRIKRRIEENGFSSPFEELRLKEHKERLVFLEKDIQERKDKLFNELRFYML